MKQVMFVMGLCAVLCSCSAKKVAVESPIAKPQQITGSTAIVSSPEVIVYKTKGDYAHLVPVQLDGQGRIISYPDPTDLRIGNRLCLPTPLHQGYWLDNRGISKGVAFLSYTYEEYSQLKSVPSLETLYSKIIDRQPLTEVHVCGRRFDYEGKDLVAELNAMIDAGKLGVTLEAK